MKVDLGAANSLLEPVIARAQQCPEQLALIFLHEDGRQETYNAGQFHESMVEYARVLAAVGLGSGELVILVMRHSPALLSAFWGAMYLGAVPAIFPYLSEKLDPERYAAQVQALVARSGVRVVITYSELENMFKRLLGGLNCQVLNTDDVSRYGNGAETPMTRLPVGDSIAFLQHSSGTTGLQKGVALSHRAVLAQLTAYGRAIGLNSDDVIASWLPLYHDMGLIAGFILPLVVGIPLVLMSPFHWVRDPKTLLWAIHEHRATLAWLPNFAYNHCAQRIRQRDLAGLDLSNWRAAINCSEPVRYESHRLFLERFAPYGFRESSLATCYAMAENTFAVTQSRLARPPDIDWVDMRALQETGLAKQAHSGASGALPVISCGHPLEGTQLRIVSDEGHPLPERHVGEIVIRSDSLLNGYYRQPALTTGAIRGGWLYTADMGYLASGQLYVSGRKKDLIIVGGKNIYPQDLEAIANEVSGIYPGRAVAFGLPDEKLGSEAIVMVCELCGQAGQEASKAVEQELRRRVVQRLDVTLKDVRLVENRWLIKTSSGKLARAANRDKYLDSLGHV